MALSVSVGGTSLEVVPFEEFEDYQGFLAHWAGRLVPPPARVNQWDHLAQAWVQPVQRRPILLRPALQCLKPDGFGVRDTGAEQAMLTRICEGLRTSPEGLRRAVETELPPAQFRIDPEAALSPEQKAQRSWDIRGQAHYAHFVLRGPVGRLSDWVLVTVAADFTLAATPASVPLHGAGAVPKAQAGAARESGALVERVSRLLASHPDAGARPSGLSARARR